MNEIGQKLKLGETSTADAIVNILPQLRGHAPDDTLSWLVNELQGYANSIDFYQVNNHHLPAYRVVKGSLMLMNTSGNLTQLNHPFAKRGQYFLAAPIAWLEEFAGLPGEMALAELPDLTSFLGSGKGTVVCQFTKDQLLSLLAQVKEKVLTIIN